MMIIDDDGRTSVSGVFGAGDATIGKAAVVLAAAAGSRAAYAINAGLARNASARPARSAQACGHLHGQPTAPPGLKTPTTSVASTPNRRTVAAARLD